VRGPSFRDLAKGWGRFSLASVLAYNVPGPSPTWRAAATHSKHLHLRNRSVTTPIVNSPVFNDLQPLALLFAAFSPLVSFLFTSLRTLFCGPGGWGGDYG
jgi:hypothetical protein